MIPHKPSDLDDAATEPIVDLPLFSERELSESLIEPVEKGVDLEPSAIAEQATLPIEAPAERPDAEPYPAPFARRFKAAALDAGALAAVLITLLAGGALLGAPSGLSALPFYLPTWLLFSFLYHVVPLLFWGRTPGMAYVGLVARSTEGGPLKIAQAIRRWAADMVTMLLLGLPGLMALSGRSLADRSSGSATRATS